MTDRSRDLADDDLVLRAGEGDEHAFEQLVGRYSGRIWSLVSGMVRDSSAVEDIVQDVFFKVHRKLPTFEGKSRFYTWLYRVAFNTASDWLKKKRLEKTVSTDDFSYFELESEQGGPDAGVRSRELRRELAAAVAELPPRYRDILVLREYEELSYEEIAEVLGCSKGTVESRLFRARARLKDKLRGLLM